jgi:hypothetical protein
MAGVTAFLGQFRQTQAALRQAEATALAERSARAVVILADRIWSYPAEVRVAAPSPRRLPPSSSRKVPRPISSALLRTCRS